MFNKKAQSALLLACLVLSWDASAAFINQVAPAPAPKTESAAKPALDDTAAQSAKPAPASPAVEVKPLAPIPPVRGEFAQIGVAPDVLSKPAGRGNGIPLGDVVPAIVPQNFRVDFGDVSRMKPVSWSGTSTWDAVLRGVAEQLPGTKTTIDWNRNLVSFKSVSAGGAAVQPASQRWEVRPADLTLRQTLMRWAKEAGWQVSWEVRFDYPVQLEAVFVGPFETAVEKFMDSLRGSEYPILGCLYEGNRVVRVLHYGDKKGCDK